MATTPSKSIPSGLMLPEILQWRAAHQPERRAYTFLTDGESEEVRLSYGELHRRARALAAYFQTLNAAGERALLLYPPGPEYVIAVFGCLYAGVIGILASPPRFSRNETRLDAVANDAQPNLVLTTGRILRDARLQPKHAAGLRDLQWIATDEAPIGLDTRYRMPATGSGSLDRKSVV